MNFLRPNGHGVMPLEPFLQLPGSDSRVTAGELSKKTLSFPEEGLSSLVV